MTKTFINHTVLTVGALAIGAALLSFTALLAHADTLPIITTTVQNGSNLTVTQAPVGTGVHAFVTVATTTGPTAPTGTVDFGLYSNTSCSGSATTQSGVALVAGAAQSATTTLNASGLSYKVHYNGDASTTVADGICATLATTTPPAVVGTISGTVYNDLNNNMVKDGSEVGSAGFVINLHQGANNDAAIVTSATTDANGHYSFGSLAVGTYYVEEINQASWKQTSMDTAVTLANASAAGVVDFSNVAASTTNNGGGNDNDHGDKGGFFKRFFNFFHHDNGNHGQGDSKGRGGDKGGYNG